MYDVTSSSTNNKSYHFIHSLNNYVSIFYNVVGSGPSIKYQGHQGKKKNNYGLSLIESGYILMEGDRQ